MAVHVVGAGAILYLSGWGAVLAPAFVIVLALQLSWGTAARVPHSAVLNRGQSAEVESVSCASVRSCSAGGVYTDASRHGQAFTVGRN